jgi:hypothetical protein
MAEMPDFAAGSDFGTFIYDCTGVDKVIPVHLFD